MTLIAGNNTAATQLTLAPGAIKYYRSGYTAAFNFSSSAVIINILDWVGSTGIAVIVYNAANNRIAYGQALAVVGTGIKTITLNTTITGNSGDKIYIAAISQNFMDLAFDQSAPVYSNDVTATYSVVAPYGSPATIAPTTDTEGGFGPFYVYLDGTNTGSSVSPALTGISITSARGTPTVTATRSVSPTLTGIAVTSSRGTLTVSSNYTGYPVTAATALQTTDSAYKNLGFVPADADRSYWPATVGVTTLTPELSSGNATGRIAAGPLTGTFTLIYYRLSNDTYYTTAVTLVDPSVTNVSLVGQQIATSSGASFVSVTTGPLLNGRSVTCSPGTFTFVVDNQDTLTGQVITMSPGQLSVSTGGSVSVPLSTRLITSSAGTLVAQTNESVSLTGQQINVGRGNITVTAQASSSTVNLPGLAINTGTSNISAVGNVTVVYRTPQFVEYVFNNTTNHP